MKLYKYYPENLNSIKAISSKSFWSHNPNFQNDPQDGFLFFKDNYSEQEFNELISFLESENFNSGDSEFSRLLKNNIINNNNLIDAYKIKLLQTFAFSSFSETNKNTLMWSHYASSHSGFVLGFEINEDIIKSNDLIKVRYTNTPLKFNLINLFKHSYGQEIYKKDLLEKLSSKSLEWQYEKEWRYWRNKKGYAPFSESFKLTDVIFGMRCPKDTVLLMLALTKEFDNIMYGNMGFDNESIHLKYYNDIDSFEKFIKNDNKFEKFNYLESIIDRKS